MRRHAKGWGETLNCRAFLSTTNGSLNGDYENDQLDL
jgi:hypothetical protein